MWLRSQIKNERKPKNLRNLENNSCKNTIKIPSRKRPTVGRTECKENFWINLGMKQKKSILSIKCYVCFLAALSSSRSLVVGLLVRPSVSPSVCHLCKKMPFRVSIGNFSHKLKNSNCNRIKKKLKLWRRKKLKNSNCDKPKNINCDKTQKFLLWQHSKTQIVIKLNISNCDRHKLWQN